MLRFHHLQEWTRTIRLLFDAALIVIMVDFRFVVLIHPQLAPGLFSLRRRLLIAILVGWTLIVVQQFFNQRFDIKHPRHTIRPRGGIVLSRMAFYDTGIHSIARHLRCR